MSGASLETFGDSSPAAGVAAPDFTLRDQYGVEVTLSAVVGDKHALLVFYPFAFSGICTGELLDIQLNIDRFANDRVQVMGISCDASPALKSWAAIEGYRFPLLSDFWPHGAVARDYGVFMESSGMAVRGTFLIDPSMTVTWSLVNGPGQSRDIATLDQAVQQFIAG
ncbi:MAG: peroxiredoxin [Ornithinimicrobium sp.]